MVSLHLEIDYSFRNFVISFQLFIYFCFILMLSAIFRTNISHFFHKSSATVACQIPLSTEFSRQKKKKNWSGQPLPSPGGLPDPGIELGSSALQAGDGLSHQGSPSFIGHFCNKASTYPNV